MRSLINETADVLVDVSLKSLLLVAIALIALVVIRYSDRGRNNVHSAHRVWTFVMISMLTLPILTLLMPSWSLPVEIGWTPKRPLETATVSFKTQIPEANSSVTERSNLLGDEAHAINDSSRDKGHRIQFADEAFSPAAPVSFREPKSPLAPAVEETFSSITNQKREATAFETFSLRAVFCWVIGLIVLILRLLIALVKTQEIIIGAREIKDCSVTGTLPKRTSMFESAAISSPVVSGILNYKIILPPQWHQWSPEKLVAVIAHESAHVQRRDGLVSLLAELTTVLYWFNPIAWVAKARLGRLAELCCDQSAALATGNRFDYARQLLEIAEHTSDGEFQPGIAMACRSEISIRIGMLLDSTRPIAKHATKFFWAMLLAFGVPALLLVASAQPVAKKLDSDLSKQDAKISFANMDSVRMDGKKLLMKFRGEILMPDGEPAKDISVKAGIRKNLDVVVDGNRFEFEAEIASRYFPGLYISAATRDGSLMVDQVIYPFAIRNAASRVIQIRLENTRSVEVRVLVEGKPVSNADVSVDVTAFNNVKGKTNPDGVFVATIPQSSKLRGISAWTTDLIGGYQFSPKMQTRNAGSSYQTVELSGSRIQKMRVIDVNGEPVSGFEFGTRIFSQKNDGYLARMYEESFVTDEQGEAIDLRFPDWSDSFVVVDPDKKKADERVTINDTKDGGDYVIKLDRSDDFNRHRVFGKIESSEKVSAGVLVELISFEHPREGWTDQIAVRTDMDGSFSADVLPGATYCVVVNDSRWVSDAWRGILYDPKTETAQSPTLDLSKGEQVEVQLTMGPDNEPIRNTIVSFSTDFRFEWLENGETKGGVHARSWVVTTDDQGRAKTRALAGRTRAYVYQSSWKPEQSLKVVPGEIATAKFHRESPGKRTVSGQIRLPKGSEAMLGGTEIQLFAMDQSTISKSYAQVDNDGRFSVEMDGSRIAVFAKTLDGQCAGSFISNKPEEGIDFELLPRTTYRGRLFGSDGKPLVNKTIRMTARLKDNETDWTKTTLIRTTFDVEVLETITDEQGMFEFHEAPQRTRLRIEAMLPEINDALEEDERSRDGSYWIGLCFLQPGEIRPRAVFRIGSSPAVASKLPITKIIKSRLRDCHLSGTHMLVAISSEGDGLEDFVSTVVNDYDKNSALLRYLPIRFNGKNSKLPEYQAYFEKRDWQRPEEDKVLLVVIDGGGSEKAKIMLDATDDDALETATKFIQLNAPATTDAQGKLDLALTEAKSTDRRVWLQFGGTRCGPCFLLSRWVDSQKSLMERDYVVVKVDQYLDTHGDDIREKYGEGGANGIPYTVVLDSTGKRLVTSKGPLGNVGHPASVEGRDHFRKMIEATVVRLNSQEIDRLIESLVQ